MRPSFLCLFQYAFGNDATAQDTRDCAETRPCSIANVPKPGTAQAMRNTRLVGILQVLTKSSDGPARPMRESFIRARRADFVYHGSTAKIRVNPPRQVNQSCADRLFTVFVFLG